MSDAPVTIIVRRNGSYRVTGPFRLVDYEGNEWDLGGRETISLCRCGASKRKPFCDGTHKTIGFEAEERSSDTTCAPANVAVNTSIQPEAQLAPQK